VYNATGSVKQWIKFVISQRSKNLGSLPLVMLQGHVLSANRSYKQALHEYLLVRGQLGACARACVSAPLRRPARLHPPACTTLTPPRRRRHAGVPGAAGRAAAAAVHWGVLHQHGHGQEGGGQEPGGAAGLRLPAGQWLCVCQWAPWALCSAHCWARFRSAAAAAPALLPRPHVAHQHRCCYLAAGLPTRLQPWPPFTPASLSDPAPAPASSGVCPLLPTTPTHPPTLLARVLQEYERRRGNPQESAFNTGRALHQLGLLHLAVPFYERSLAAAPSAAAAAMEGLAPPDLDLSHAAAHNLALIYRQSGADDLARQVLARHLVV
jgi:hypothetical protein